MTKKNLSSLMKSVFDRPIAFHRCFVEIAGGVTPALMLSQGYYWSGRTSDPDGWFWKTSGQWEEETGMTAIEILIARRKLRDTTFWSEELRGAPPKLYYRIDHEALLKVLEGNATSLSLEDCLARFKSQLSRMSKAGLMRARKAKVESVYVAYSDVLQSHGMNCYLCAQPIAKGPGDHTASLSFGYVLALKAGGTHKAENIRPKHAGCVAEIQDSGDGQFSCGKEFNSLSVRELNSFSGRELNPLSVKEIKALTVRKSSIITTETTPEISSESTALAENPPTVFSILQEFYSNTITGQSEVWRMEQVAIDLDCLQIAPDQLRRFLSETTFRPVGFVRQNFLTWREQQVREFEKRLIANSVGGRPEDTAKRVADYRRLFSTAGRESELPEYLQSEPQPEPQSKSKPVLRLAPQPEVAEAGSAQPNIWDDVLARIEEQINSESFSTWFRPSKLVAVSGQTLTIQLPDPVFQDWILNNYRDLLEEVLESAGLGESEILFQFPEIRQAA